MPADNTIKLRRNINELLRGPASLWPTLGRSRALDVIILLGTLYDRCCLRKFDSPRPDNLQPVQDSTQSSLHLHSSRFNTVNLTR
jgi:hypothetical protein